MSKTAKKEIRRPLKPRDLRFLKAKTDNPDLPDYKAAMIATGAKNMNVASTDAARMLHNATLREALDAAFAKLGYSIDQSAKTLIEATQAKKTYQLGTEMLESDLPDHGIRISATRTILSFLGEKNEPSGGNTINFNFPASPQQR